MQLTFLGATGTVTGSKYLVRAAGRTVLVDCGLFQGLKQLRLRNWAQLPVDAASIDAVVLTHAHLDHSGYLPLLVRNGFRGKVYGTRATRDLCGVLLPDSARLQEEEAEHANRHGYSKHQPALPLYTVGDAARALERLEPIDFDARIEVAPGIAATLMPAGHMLGAALVQLEADGRSVLFSGDLGRNDDPIMRPPRPAPRADYVVVESTYGDRRRSRADPQRALADVLSRTFARGGIVVVPSFAVGRAQALLYLIHLAKQAGAIPDVPVYLDSPMAVDATEIYCAHRAEHRLTPDQCGKMCDTARIVRSPEESRWLDSRRMPMVIIAGSGMAAGGRVVHHIKALGPDARNTILFTGYQAAGTRGAAMVGGASSVKIHGAYVTLHAEIALLDMLSAHADRDEILDWLGGLEQPPRRVFVTHGEPVAADALRLAIQERFGWPCDVPDYRDSVTLA
ncbi:MAG: MBL fold hydrolase [Betaproteobacteria bacterium]|nr:MAG: MBL fold hydrolase [Betaproteobacteria bacterium]